MRRVLEAKVNENNANSCRFLISQLFPDCKYKQTDVEFVFGEESFHWSGNTLVDPGFTLINTWQAIGSAPQTSAQFVKGQEWNIVQVGAVLLIMHFSCGVVGRV